jgi:hypothetical protein
MLWYCAFTWFPNTTYESFSSTKREPIILSAFVAGIIWQVVVLVSCWWSTIRRKN